MQPDRIADGDFRERRTVRAAAARVVTQRRKGAIRTTDDVRTSNEITIGVDDTAGTDEVAPPIIRIHVARQRVTHDHDVVGIIVEFAPRPESDGYFEEYLAAFQFEFGQMENVHVPDKRCDERGNNTSSDQAATTERAACSAWEMSSLMSSMWSIASEIRTGSGET